MHYLETYELSEFSTIIHSELPKFLLDKEKRGEILAVFDTNTVELFSDYGGPSVVLEAGEQSKTFQSIQDIISNALDSGLGRDGEIIGVGGGVVCDIAAFTASIYMRGLRLSLVPTSLLAMVDASFGGKTGVDFAGYKNIVGSFYPANNIYLEPSLLSSLPEVEYYSGMAELIKTGMLGDQELFGLLEERLPDFKVREAELLKEAVWRAVRVKAVFVTDDLREAGRRAYLNLGHTFGHALESVSGLGKLTHGEAVAWGIGKAMDAGVKIGLTDPRYARRVKDLLSAYGYRLEIGGVNSDALLKAMSKDKKKKGTELRFVLQRRLCDTVLESLPEGLVLDVLEQ